MTSDLRSLAYRYELPMNRERGKVAKNCYSLSVCIDVGIEILT